VAVVKLHHSLNRALYHPEFLAPKYHSKLLQLETLLRVTDGRAIAYTALSYRPMLPRTINRYQSMIDVIFTFDYIGLLEISEILIVSDVFFDFKFHQIRFLPRLRPDPGEELIQHSPCPSIGWGGNTPPTPPPLSPSSALWSA